MEANRYPLFSKRLKIVYLASGLTGLLFLALQLPTALFYWGVIVLAGAAYIAAILGLDRDLRREEWIVLPLYCVLATVIFYAWASTTLSTIGVSLVAAVGFGLSMYGLMLTLNIINVSTVRTIPLARPASTVLSMTGLAGSFGLYHLTLINQPSLLNWVLSVGGSTLLISWPLVWVSLSPKLRFQRSLAWSVLSALLLMQLALVVSFWPSSFLSSLVLSVVLFLILGIFHLQQKRQLNQAVKRQYLLLGGVVALFFLLLSQW